MRDVQKISALTLWALATAGLAGVALAEGMPGMKGEMDGMDPAALFASLDTDGDGKLTAAELEAAHQARFAAADADKDGFLSADELAQMQLTEMAEMLAARSARMIERMDGNGDGLLAPDEMAMGPEPAKMIEHLDSDNDGAVSLEEAEEMAKGHHGGHGRGKMGMGHGGGHGRGHGGRHGGFWGMFGGAGN